MKKVYNKLVRDEIIKIIERDGHTCKSRILSSCEYLECLNKKLEEEVNEYLLSNEVVELADIMEVIEAILEAKKIDKIEFEKIKTTKFNKNGGFSKKIYLEYVEITNGNTK
ncbi:MAG: nucleoside triphosphate pyrophosphohydrolase [Acholeplasmatales bacterium]|jgi:predicted house-cleaning noncanonical NTP pyrophosphatase (MazG superfamily)|nr:nucleoside triphosphate pyrophosphohydrolase [Acholeplasmatales bacterium]